VAGVYISREKVEKLIRGRRGTDVSIHVKRDGEVMSAPIKVVRDQGTVGYLDVVYMIEPGVGYVKVRRVGINTADEVRQAIIALRKQGAQKLILDLRDNGGGYFHMAIKVASEFFADKRLIVYTQGAHEERHEYYSDSINGGHFATEDLTILINENTASASEIVAGAVQDWDRGTIIGRRSYGKGIVQEQFDFSDGSTVNLSIARYFTPLGRSIQKKYMANWSIMDDFSSMYSGLW